MPMIEGIGDEVVHCFCFLVVGVLGVVAWWSTGIRERPLIRTVLILEHRSRGASDSGSSRPQRARAGSGNPMAGSQHSEADGAEINSVEGTAEPQAQTKAQEDSAQPSPSLSEADLIKQRRIAYFKKPKETSGSDVETADHPKQQPENAEHSTPGSAGNIRVRLKYLNDDQKLVEGRLQEMLGEFKRRHFSVELSGDKLVRLIFNGQMLQSDDETLEGYGFYDNCVVHCLVHNQRGGGGGGGGTATNQSRGGASANGGQAPLNPSAPADWNLGIVLYISISLILGLGWFVRYHYSQLFTMATTAGLVGLTSIFAVSVIGLYMPD